MARAPGTSSPSAQRGGVTEHGGLLAANLKRLRQYNRQTLSQVARDAGISKATLSGLEAGGGNPTMSTLANLAAALRATPSDLLSRVTDEELKVVRAGDPVDLDGPVVSVQFVDRVAEPWELTELYHMRVPHTEEPQHSPGHPGVEHLIVRIGRLRIGPVGQETEVGPGDYVSFDGSRPHSYWALEGPVEVTYLLTYPDGGSSHPRV